VVKYQSLSQLPITFSTLTCVVFPLSRHVLIKTATIGDNHPSCVQTSFSSIRSSYTWSMVRNADVNVRSNEPKMARDINCQPANGCEPHRLDNNHDSVTVPSSYGQFSLSSESRSETYDSHVYLVFFGQRRICASSTALTLRYPTRQSLCFVLAIVRHVVLLFHDTTLHCQSNPAVSLGGVTQTPSVWSTLRPNSSAEPRTSVHLVI
jgi:hypothetical protein